jgi:hypothetical protein
MPAAAASAKGCRSGAMTRLARGWIKISMTARAKCYCGLLRFFRGP